MTDAVKQYSFELLIAFAVFLLLQRTVPKRGSKKKKMKKKVFKQQIAWCKCTKIICMILIYMLSRVAYQVQYNRLLFYQFIKWQL